MGGLGANCNSATSIGPTLLLQHEAAASLNPRDLMGFLGTDPSDQLAFDNLHPRI